MPESKQIYAPEGGAAQALLAQNEQSACFGLELQPQEVEELLQEQQQMLRDTGRLLLNDDLLPELVRRFCGSAYVAPRAWAATLLELVRIFYAYRAELSLSVRDEEILDAMRDGFDACKGSPELLEGSWMHNYLCRCRGVEEDEKAQESAWMWGMENGE